MSDGNSSMSDMANFFNEKLGTDHVSVSLSSEVENEITQRNIENFYTKLEELGYNLDELREILDSRGSMLILSGAGSGKTTALILKIIRDLISGDLIKTQVINGVRISSQANILVSTFLRSGAAELEQSFNDWCRKLNLVGVDSRNIHFKTIHSEVYSALKLMNVNINIIPDSEANNLLKGIMNKYGIHSVLNHGKNISVDEVADISCLISYVRNRLDSQRFNHPLMEEYTIDSLKLDALLLNFKQHKLAAGGMDFEDLQEMLLDGLRCNPKVVELIQSRYDFIYVDEFQDTSQLQYEILKYYFQGARKVLAIGDDDQCLVEGTKIITPQGEINIEDVKVGDKVLAATGHGKSGYSRVESVSKKKVSEDIVVVKTKSGKILKATKNHIGFARFEPTNEHYYVYLMHKKGLGYRIGMTSSVKVTKMRSLQNGFQIRLNQEGADETWILKVCKEIEEARYYETYFSCAYGVPQLVFKIQKQPYKSNFSEELIEKLHFDLDTETRGSNLLKDLGMYKEYPHWVRQQGIGMNKINFTMFGSVDYYGENLKQYANELTTSSANEDYLKIVKENIKSCNKKRVLADGRDYYNARLISAKYDNQFKIVKSIEDECKKQGVEVSVQVSAKLTDKKYNFTPFGHMREGMYIPVYNEIENVIVEEEIESVNYESYTGFVYDLNIEQVRNFVANSIVIKNCIYSWRGSDIEIINKKFEEDFKPEVKQLTMNYRCSQNILNAVIPSIEKNTMRHPKKLRAAREGGIVDVVIDGNVNHLMKGVKSDLEKGETVGIIARTNADLLIPALLLELDEKEINFGLSKSVSLENRLPKQVFGLMDLVTKRYTQEFESMLKLFIPRNQFYEAEKLCDVLNINKEKSLYNIPISDIAYSAPNLYNLINGIRMNKEVSAKRAYLGILKLLPQQVYGSNSIYAQRARDFVYYVEKIITEHYMVKDMSLEQLDELFNTILPQKLNRRKRTDSTRLFIKVTTVHEAKGKEWDNVYIWNDIEGCFPNSVGNRDLTPSEFEEERRVHYIAWTRPKKKLTVYTRSDREGGFIQECDLSNANILEMRGIKSRINGVSQKETTVFEKKETVKEVQVPKTFEEIVDAYYKKYTNFTWIVKSEGMNLDTCDRKLGGKEKVIEVLKSKSIHLYPPDMIEHAITDTLSELACITLR